MLRLCATLWLCQLRNYLGLECQTKKLITLDFKSYMV
jgi:hypothetical protein